MYLETIYRLSQMSESVRSVDVGNYMGVSKPSARRAVGLLKSGGYINIDIDGLLTMTDEGLEVASEYTRGIRCVSYAGNAWSG